jgi:hypothetical protein
MNVKFLSNVYKDFEKNPKARSEWAEAQVRNFIDKKMNFPVFSTEDIIKNKVNLEEPIKVVLDGVFKNEETYSIDLVFIYENEEMKKQREKDRIFVESIIEAGKPYDLGSFLRDRHYHFDMEYEKTGKRVGIHLIPLLFFVEVKSFLTDSKPPFMSENETYKLNYALKELGLPIIIAFVEIDIKKKVAYIGLKLVEKIKGLREEWIKLFPERDKGFPSLKIHKFNPNVKGDIPLLIPKNGEPQFNVQFIDPKDHIEVVGDLVGTDLVIIDEVN